jgi:deazaflavin-dependent oxidoreductase (nitroreductase family)
VPLDGEYTPSPWGPVADQVELYERTGGREGNTFADGPCIILTTRGRASGTLRKSPLIRVTDGTSYAVIASMGGAPDEPLWAGNIRAEAHVVLQDGPEPRDFTAHEAFGEEKALWWKRAVEVWPDYDAYQEATERVIALFVLDPRA